MLPRSPTNTRRLIEPQSTSPTDDKPQPHVSEKLRALKLQAGADPDTMRQPGQDKRQRPWLRHVHPEATHKVEAEAPYILRATTSKC